MPLVQELSGMRPAPISDEPEQLLTARSSRSLISETSSSSNKLSNSTDDSKTIEEPMPFISPLDDRNTNKGKHDRQLTPVVTKNISASETTKKKEPAFELRRILQDNTVGPKEMIGVAVEIQLPGLVSVNSLYETSNFFMRDRACYRGLRILYQSFVLQTLLDDLKYYCSSAKFRPIHISNGKRTYTRRFCVWHSLKPLKINMLKLGLNQ